MGRRQGPTTYILNAMGDALLKLMKTTPIEKITVQEITDACGAGRATFFRHFSSKSELLEYRILSMWREYLNSEAKESVDLMPVLFEFCYARQSSFQILYVQHEESCIRNALEAAMTESGIFSTDEQASAAEQYFKAYRRSGMAGMLCEWMRKECKESPAEMIYLIGRIL